MVAFQQSNKAGWTKVWGGIAALFLGLALAASTDAAINIPSADYDALWRQYSARDVGNPPAMDFPYMECFEKEAKRNGLPVTLLLAVARGESDFDPNAVSHAGAIGVMQLMRPTAKDMGVPNPSDLYKPCVNIKAGSKYLKYLIERYNNDVNKALAAYNYGLGRVSVDGPPELIPELAQWYSGYIYHHLGVVMASATAPVDRAKPRKVYASSGKIKVIHFHSPYKASAFLVHYQKLVPKVRLDLFKDNIGRYFIYMLFDGDKERKRSIERLRNVGFDVELEAG